ncbi:MFS transporter [Leifsonia sp. NPDC080035]|uniref:MFS transporter n=1 Tax=Leifsonia sp. NPDC080035 TaxID=3143936 RepID=A0AAU7GJC4_9MICO
MSHASPPGTAASPVTKAAIGGVVGFLVVMELGSGMLQGWYPVLLTAIGGEFGVSAAALNWVSAGYMLATIVFVPVIAKLGDRYGHKKLLAVSAALVALGSIVVAIAPNFAVLLLGRALQAPLAAFLPLEFAIVRDRDEKSSGRSIGKLVGALTFGAAIGALGAGLLFNATANLRLVLWVPAIFLALCVPVVLFLVPESKARATGRIDWIGASLLGIGMLLALGGIGNAATLGWTNPVTWIVIVAGIALLALWVVVERRVAHPLIEISVLTKGGIGLPIVIAFLFGAQLFGSQTATTVYMLTDPAKAGFGLGVSPGTVGILSVITALAAFVAATLGDRLATRVGSKLALVAGGLLLVVSYLILVVGAHSLAVVAVGMVVGGQGNGILIAVLPAIVVKRAPADSVGIASALYNTSRTAAGAVAGALFALVMGSFLVTLGSGPTAVTTTAFAGYVAVWLICAAIGAAVVVLSLFIREKRVAADADTVTVVTDAAAIPTTPPIAAGETA